MKSEHVTYLHKQMSCTQELPTIVVCNHNLEQYVILDYIPCIPTPSMKKHRTMSTDTLDESCHTAECLRLPFFCVSAKLLKT
jgi:hypothetical protein